MSTWLCVHALITSLCFIIRCAAREKPVRIYTNWMSLYTVLTHRHARTILLLGPHLNIGDNVQYYSTTPASKNIHCSGMITFLNMQSSNSRFSILDWLGLLSLIKRPLGVCLYLHYMQHGNWSSTVSVPLKYYSTLNTSLIQLECNLLNYCYCLP